MREKARTDNNGWSTTMIVGFLVVFAGSVGRASPAATSSGFRLDWSYSAGRFDLDLESAVPESSLVPSYLESPQRSVPRIERQADQPPVPVPLPVRRPDPQSLPLLFASDLRALLMAPAQFDRKAWRNVGLAVGLIGAVSLFDDEIHGSVRYDSRPATTTFAQRIRPLGREASLALLGGPG